jgi:ABC-type transport system involved in cytochrome c biogenesis ATPase subunit
MLLTDLNITACRGIRDLELKPLAPVTLLVGENNVGKSSLLEAAALLLRPFDEQQWVRIARNRDLDNSLSEILWTMFPDSRALTFENGSQHSEELSVGGTCGGLSRELIADSDASTRIAGKNQEVLLSVALHVGNGDSGSIPDSSAFMILGTESAERTASTSILMYPVKTVTPSSHRSSHLLVEELSHAINGGYRDTAVDMLRFFDDRVQGLDVTAVYGASSIRVTHSTRGIVDVSSFGDGMRRSMALALGLAGARGGVLLVDELEAGIHPRMLPIVMKHLTKAATAAGTQILATTHSIEAVDAMIGAMHETPDQMALFYLRRNDSGEGLRVRRYEYPYLVSLRESGVDLR